MTITAAMWWYFVIVSPLIMLAGYFFYRAFTARKRIDAESSGDQEKP